MLEKDFEKQLQTFEKYYEIKLDSEIIKGYKERYLKLEYFIFAGMLKQIFDTFIISRYKKSPNYVDFNAARAIMNERATPEPVKEEPKGKYVPYSSFGTFSRLLQEINRWYDQGILWDFNGTLKPLTYPRTYKNPCIIFQKIAEESEKYFNNFTKLDEFYKKSMERLKDLRLKRRKEGNFKERKMKFENL